MLVGLFGAEEAWGGQLVRSEWTPCVWFPADAAMTSRARTAGSRQYGAHVYWWRQSRRRGQPAHAQQLWALTKISVL